MLYGVAETPVPKPEVPKPEEHVNTEEPAKAGFSTTPTTMASAKTEEPVKKEEFNSWCDNIKEGSSGFFNSVWNFVTSTLDVPVSFVKMLYNALFGGCIKAQKKAEETDFISELVSADLTEKKPQVPEQLEKKADKEADKEADKGADQIENTKA